MVDNRISLAALLGIGSIFGAWEAGLLDPLGQPVRRGGRLRGSKVDLGCYSFNAPGLMLMLK